MSFEGFHDKNSACQRVTEEAPAEPAMPSATGVISHTLLSSTGLSLGLKTNVDGGYGSGMMMAARIGSREFHGSCAENECRSESDNYLDGVSGEDFDPENPKGNKKRKRYHRHTPQQIQELENVFKECPHPDDKQRTELSKRLCLENRQVKFWFQNRRTQMKTQLERHENSLLRLENDKLRSENMSVNNAVRNPICTNCGGLAMPTELSLEEHHLRIENARLKDELERVCCLTGRFLDRPLFPSIPPNVPNSSLELAVGGGNAFDGFGSLPTVTNTTSSRVSVYLDLALSAMNELEKLVHMKDPIWISHSESGKETINYEEYLRVFPRIIGEKPIGFVSEATRESGNVIINSSALVDTLMDADRWCDIFSCMIARASTTDVISSGMARTRNGALQLMHAEFQVLSPLVPIREANFLRFCKQHADGLWAVVDVSIDGIINGNNTFMSCRRLPSGCVVQDLCNGYSKVTWIEHVEYDESTVHQLYRRLLRSGMGLGAQRWLSTLRRQCECLGILTSPSAPSRYLTNITAIGRRSMLKLAQRMTDNFCAGVCPSTVHQWNILRVGTVDEDVRVMTRKSVDNPGEPPGVVLSAATSVWLPVSTQRLFDFLRDERLRSEWDILSNGGPMQEMAHITKGQDVGNCVSLLRSSALIRNQSSMLILQETCTDPSASLVVYAPVDIPAMQLVMNGGDSAYVALLPSGFAIVPVSMSNSNSIEKSGVLNAIDDDIHARRAHEGGSLLTVAFQILVNSLPTAKLTVESVETVNNLISCTVQKIKASLQCENIRPAS